MSAPARVSVIVPVYNGAAFLPALFGRMGAQSFRDFELIVADDGSDDGTAALAEQLAGSAPFPTTVLRTERNGGPAAARNRGLQAAAGEIVAFCDVDDRWMPEKLARQVRMFDLDPDLTMVGTQGVIRLNDGAAAGMLVPPDVFAMDEPCLALFWDPYLQTSAVAIRRQALAGRAFDESFVIGEDRDLFIRLAMDGKLGLLDEPLCEYVRVPESMMARQAFSRRGDTIRMTRLNLARYGHRLTRAQRRFALGKAFYDVGETLIDPPHSRLSGARYLARAASLGYRRAACLQKTLAFLARKSPLRRGGG